MPMYQAFFENQQKDGYAKVTPLLQVLKRKPLRRNGFGPLHFFVTAVTIFFGSVYMALKKCFFLKIPLKVLRLQGIIKILLSNAHDTIKRACRVKRQRRGLCWPGRWVGMIKGIIRIIFIIPLTSKIKWTTPTFRSSNLYNI